MNRSIALLVAFLVVLVPAPARAHLPVQLFQGAELYEAGVIRSASPSVVPDAYPRMPGGLYRQPLRIEVSVEMLTGAFAGQTVTVESFLTGNPSTDVLPEPGTRVIVGESRLADGRTLHLVHDYDRRPTLAWVTVLSLLSLLLLGLVAGLKAVAAIGASLVLLYGLLAPILLSGVPAVPLAGLASVVIAAGTILMALPRSPERVAALAGMAVGLAITLVALMGCFNAAHVTGLGTADALFLYVQAMTFTSLDYRQLWFTGGLFTVLGGLVLGNVLLARAIAAAPLADSRDVARREIRSLLPALALLTGLFYFGSSLSLLLASRLDTVSPLRVSVVRFLNYDYLVSILLTWECGLLGLVASMLVTPVIAHRLRARRHAP